MTGAAIHIPPAPPPFWQVEPVAANPPVDSARSAATASVVAAGVILAFRLRKRRNSLRADEHRLRAQLAQTIGPDAFWLSAENAGIRLGEAGIAAGDPAHRSLDRLKALEARRFGPPGAEDRHVSPLE